MLKKFCKKCNLELDIESFPTDKKMVGGHQNFCRECQNEKDRIRRQIKKEKGTYVKPNRNEYNKNYYLNNKKKIKDSSESYYEDNSEKIKEYQRNRRQIKKDYLRDYHREYNKKKQYKINRYKNDLNFRITHILRNRFLETVKKNYKNESALKLLGCSIQEFKIYIEGLFKPGMTWENHGFGDKKWHLDHKVPCDFFDLTLYENQLKCFHYTNFQPLWQKENLKKSNSVPEGTTNESLRSS